MSTIFQKESTSTLTIDAVLFSETLVHRRLKNGITEITVGIARLPSLLEQRAVFSFTHVRAFAVSRPFICLA
jgi:hypothetical protein